MQPMCSVASPRWLWVATGTLLQDPLDLPVAEVVRGEALAGAGGDQLLRAGQAVIPVADTPTMRRVPCSKATARP